MVHFRGPPTLGKCALGGRAAGDGACIYPSGGIPQGAPAGGIPLGDPPGGPRMEKPPGGSPTVNPQDPPPEDPRGESPQGSYCGIPPRDYPGYPHPHSRSPPDCERIRPARVSAVGGREKQDNLDLYRISRVLIFPQCKNWFGGLSFIFASSCGSAAGEIVGGMEMYPRWGGFWGAVPGGFPGGSFGRFLGPGIT